MLSQLTKLLRFTYSPHSLSHVYKSSVTSIASHRDSRRDGTSAQPARAQRNAPARSARADGDGWPVAAGAV